MIRVAVIDDHAVVRMGLKYSISLDDELELAGELSGGAGAGDFVLKTKPDVVLLDVRMPNVNGIAALGDILSKVPDAKVVMLTTSEADEDVFQAMTLGARGYLIKDENGDDIFKAVRKVASGGTWIPAQIREIYNARKRRVAITDREREVLTLLVKGFQNEEIGRRLGISFDTVKQHVKHIFEKLDVSTRVEAATEAIRTGLVEP